LLGPLTRPLDRKATLAFATALAIPLALVVFATGHLRALETASEWVDHSHQVIEALETVGRRLAEAEASARGYMLDGDARYRGGYERAAVAVSPGLARVRALASDNPEQQRRIDTLGALAGAKLAELATAIRARDGHGVTSAEAALRATGDSPLMRRFDELSARMEREERDLLAERARERAESLRRLRLAMALGPLLALLIAVLALRRVRRAGLERLGAERERDASAAALAMQSLELSAQNEELIAQGEALQVTMDLAEGANAAKSAFLAQMSHELRTPLNSVIGFANIVRRNPRGALNESEVTYLDRVVENGRHLLRTINSILDLSKIEANHETVELEVVSLHELAREVLASLETQADVAGITLGLDAPATLASVVTDRDKLRRVLVNLAANAVKFTKAGGSVRIRLEAVPLSPTTPAAIEVHDSGVGIAPNRLAAIFEAFEQGDIGVGREYGGTGLGLSISRALCRLLHYELTVRSTLGVGSVFRVALSPGAVAGHRPRTAPARPA
jgi:signal transduction histidine kinase